ncbi:hypothetical protein [Natronococcus occultus]|uniref:hypothetical protein n=1 Tax=Natronococcus occultus TaxID=29288 RepID=UPI001FE1EB0D|nr:hypothetical protein [Natronococcus occultus]
MTVYEFVAALDDRSLAVLDYCWYDEHASIPELTALVDAETNMATLTVRRERLNRSTREIRNQPTLEFETRDVDSRTGWGITFERWFTGDPPRQTDVASLHETEVTIA